MARLALVAILLALVTASVVSALRLDYSIRLYSRGGGWVNSARPEYGAKDAPILVEEEKSSFGLWVLKPYSDDSEILVNQANGWVVLQGEPGRPLFTGRPDNGRPADVRFKYYDVSTYHIIDGHTGLYWTRYNGHIILDKPGKDDSQLWEFRPPTLDDELAFWE
ncbi:hypothetical protein BGZ73_008189 [Actinomortierella ambigua]|nr:hypothetical protein BGZ73_008189 [Actinomortierella ambigua]